LPKWSSSSALTNSIIYNSVTGIGINTTTPRAALEVNGQIYASNGAIWSQDNQGFLIGDLSAGASYAFISGVGSTGASSYLTFSTNYSERLRIISNGNVGIGLTNPAYKLDVNGDVNVTGNFKINGVNITTGGGSLSGSGTTNYHAKWSSSSSLSASLIYDNATSIAFFNQSNGTGYALEFNNNYAQARMDIVENGTYTAVVKSYNSAAWFANNSNNPVIIGTNGTERIRVTGTGEIGIGVSSPNKKLEVYSTYSGNYTAQVKLFGSSSASGRAFD